MKGQHGRPEYARIMLSPRRRKLASSVTQESFFTPLAIRVKARRLLAAGSLSVNLPVEDSSLVENCLQRLHQGLMTLLPMQDLGHGNGLGALGGGDVAVPNLSFMRTDFFNDPLFFLPQEIEPIPGGLDDVKLLWKQFTVGHVLAIGVE
jgi:hypothetical protein